MTPLEALKKYFGYDEFRPGQEEIINSILSKRSVLACLPTGAGKSLCYQIPALISPNFSIVVSPLISLMKDQVDALNRNGEVAAFINSSVDFRTIEKIYQGISLGTIKLLYVAPERFEIASFAERIRLMAPQYLFVDEAHCISEWGHNFRPSYRKISQFVINTEIKKIAAFTATATPEVRDDIVVQLGLKDPEVFVKGFKRENIALNVTITTNKNQKVFELLSSYPKPAIIYTASRKKTEEVYRFLIQRKVNALYYHAGLGADDRKRIQDSFISGKSPVIVATNAFGMGIDKKDVRTVIHVNLPGTIESYYQEFGRAGRDGLESAAFLLFDKSDLNIQNFFIANTFPRRDLIRKVYDAICDCGPVALGSMTQRNILFNADLIRTMIKEEASEILLSSILTILSEAGYIRLNLEGENKTLLSFAISKEELKEYTKQSQDNLKREIILEIVKEFGSDPFVKFIDVNIDNLSEKIGISADLVSKLIDSLEFNGILELQKVIPKRSISLPYPRIHSANLRLNYKKIDDNFIYAQRKLDKMVEYAYTRDCRFNYILRYFGDNEEDYKCGKCDCCTLNDMMPEVTYQYLSECIMKTLLEFNDGLTEQQLLNLLLGKSKAANLMKSNMFGTCANYSVADLIPVTHYLVSQELAKKNPLQKDKIFLTNKGFSTLESLGLLKQEEEDKTDYETNLKILHALKEIRDNVANTFMQAKSIVCGDDIMQKIAVSKPRSRFELLSIEGFTERMYNKLGEEFLEVVNALCEQRDDKGTLAELTKDEELPPNVIETLNLILAGNSLSDIAMKRNLALPVVSMQIETILEKYPKTDISKLISSITYNKIDELYRTGSKALREVKERLPEDVSYAEIRIVLAKLRTL